MIVITSRYLKRRTSGSGVFSNIIKNIFTSSTKNAIKKAIHSEAGHKLANAVVNGAVSGTQTLVNNVVSDLKRKEEKTSNDQPLQKKVKLNIYDIIGKGGSGIVLD